MFRELLAIAAVDAMRSIAEKPRCIGARLIQEPAAPDMNIRQQRRAAERAARKAVQRT